MNILIRAYPVFLRAVGVVAAVASVALMVRQGLTFQGLLILGLVVPAAWLRINIEPAGYVTLAPLVVFVSFLLADPLVAVVAATASPLIGPLVSRQRQWANAWKEAGGEGIAVVAGVILVSQTGLAFRQSTSGDWAAPFSLAAGVYIIIRYLWAAFDAKVSERVTFVAYAKTGGREVIAHLTFLVILAVTINYLANTFGGAGLFMLALATVALVEAYYPYKQLSDQRDVLFANLAMIAHAIDLKDAYTGRHARDASGIAVRIARTLHLPEPEVRRIRLAALLHDIGKTGVSGRIIRKPAALSAEEMDIMRQHPAIGAEIMRPVELLADSAELVRHHHEHFDGSGYPDGLADGEIPLGSRILLVADAFNAITTDRPYRRARSKEEALAILRDGAGKQFDPLVVKALESVAAFL